MALHGLVTLTGSGGCGKTRLALQVAAEALGGRADEAWFVDLSGLADPGLVPAAVMAAMAVQEVRHQSHAETLTTGSGPGALIVLDNCEHVLGAASALAEGLVRHCGRLVVLATSRQPSRSPARSSGVCLVCPCRRTTARWKSSASTPPKRSGCSGTVPAASRANFAITNDNAPAVTAICQRLDGIPWPSNWRPPGHAC